MARRWQDKRHLQHHKPAVAATGIATTEATGRVVATAEATGIATAEATGRVVATAETTGRVVATAEATGVLWRVIAD